MKAVAYEIERAATLAAAARRLAEGVWGAKAIAGGQSLGAMLNLRLVQPERLIDLDQIDGLRAVREDAAAVTLGAMITHAEIEDGRIPDPCHGLMAHVARGIAYRAVRNRGTIGGSLCHADPAADWVTTLPLLGATLTLVGSDGASRELPAAGFMLAAFETQLADSELLASIRVPKRSASARWSYRKLRRKTGEFADALAAALRDPADGTERLVLGALDGAPRILDRPGLLGELGLPGRPEALLREAGLDLDATRFAQLAEMLRRIGEDMKI
jgi:carbon-monoxide dehydrogenase medium subunit